MSAPRLGLELGRVNQRPLDERLGVVLRYPSHLRAAAVVAIEHVLDLDLLTLFGQFAPVQVSDVDSMLAGLADVCSAEHKHHLVDVLFDHAADLIAAGEIVRA